MVAEDSHVPPSSHANQSPAPGAPHTGPRRPTVVALVMAALPFLLVAVGFVWSKWGVWARGKGDDGGAFFFSLTYTTVILLPLLAWGRRLRRRPSQVPRT